jgi:hypothetical protein
LFVGVAVSLFSAITVTRTLLRTLNEMGAIRDSWLLGLGRHDLDNLAQSQAHAD